MNTIYDIRKGRLYNDLDCPFDSEINKIDVYSSVYWTARTEKEYTIKEKTINDFSFENDLVKANAWCDISGFDYWVKTMEEKNHLLILQALQDFEDECGTLTNKPKPTDETQYFNWLAWFAWESTMSEVMNFLEN